MGVFKTIYEAKKHEMEVKQGKHGIVQKYLVLVPLLCLYWYKALFIPGKEVFLPLLVPVTILFIFAIRKDLKNKRQEEIQEVS